MRILISISLSLSIYIYRFLFVWLMVISPNKEWFVCLIFLFILCLVGFFFHARQNELSNQNKIVYYYFFLWSHWEMNRTAVLYGKTKPQKESCVINYLSLSGAHLFFLFTGLLALSLSLSLSIIWYVNVIRSGTKWCVCRVFLVSSSRATRPYFNQNQLSHPSSSSFLSWLLLLFHSWMCFSL